MKAASLLILFTVSLGFVWFETEAASQKSGITIRTEIFPRPPYSGATYYIYERDGEVICTKLKVCNKYNNCGVTYRKGSFMDAIDEETGEPRTTKPVLIRRTSLRKHVCLTRFKLV